MENTVKDETIVRSEESPTHMQRSCLAALPPQLTGRLWESGGLKMTMVFEIFNENEWIINCEYFRQ